MDKTTKTVVKQDKFGVYCITPTCGYVILPPITDVRVHDDSDGNPRCVQVYFGDGSFTKAVLQKNDVWDFDTALSVCITKKLLDAKTGGHGHQTYNKLVRLAKHVYERRQKDTIKYQTALLEEREQDKRRQQKREKATQKRDAKKYQGFFDEYKKTVRELNYEFAQNQTDHIV